MLPVADVRADVSLFFLHHSTGRNLISEGDVRQIVSEMDGGQEIQFNNWDHDYDYLGLMDPGGNLLGYSFNTEMEPDNNPVDLHRLWTTSNAARDSILNNYQVIAFKPCYPASDIVSDAMLAQYKVWYNEMGEVFDQYPDKVFLIMSQPPRHRLRTSVEEADRARAFANWLGDEYVTNHSNMMFFDFFDRLARADDGSSTRNMLRYEYERSHSDGDSHPNPAANMAIAPDFAEALVGAAQVPVQNKSLGSMKAMFR